MNDRNNFQFTPSVWIVPTLLLGVIWAIFLAEWFGGYDWTQYGIQPRTISGLRGILFSPFLHGSWEHIANNSVPLFLLTMALIYFYRDLSLKILFYGILSTGILTWLIGRNSYHIGASSLIYVLVSFIFFKGLFTKYYRLMALSMTIALIYGGMIWYVLPKVDDTISWEGHLSGLITGLAFAIWYKTPDYVAETRYPWQESNYDIENDKFMQRFDENGNFVNLPPPEPEIEEIQEIQQVKYVYDFKPSETKPED